MFIGRQSELANLDHLYNQNSFQFGIVHGRRRIGKTTLLRESIKGRRALFVVAQQANAKTNLELMSNAYGIFKGVGPIIFGSYQSLFEELFSQPSLIVIIDEFTYLTTSDPTFESMLQELIDRYHSTSTLKLVISGSEVGMFENLFAYSKPLFNRQTFNLQLKECDYYESSLYYPNLSNEDKVRAYAIFGGLPYYLAQVSDQLSIKENIIRLVVSENARFASEVQTILHTELRSIQEYQSILQAIHSGSTRLSDIDVQSRIQDTAKTSKYINKLVEIEMIEKEQRFGDSSASKKSLYRIKNNFIAFYYRFIWKNQSARVIMDAYDFYDYFIAPSLDEYVSVRFESLCCQFLIREFKHRNKIPLLGLGRYWYNDRKQQKDIEIDCCITTPKGVYIYECKWTNSPIDQRIMNDLIVKGTEVHAVRYGAFSKSGYHPSLSNHTYDLITIDDLYNVVT